MKMFLLKVGLLLPISLGLAYFIPQWFVLGEITSFLLGGLLGNIAVLGALIWNRGI